MKNQQLIKGILFGIPIGMALFGCGYAMQLSGMQIIQAAAIFCLLAIADWIVRTKNQRKLGN